MDRRRFVQGAAGAVGLMFVKPETAFGYAANSRVRWGLLGCGNRGSAVATSFAKNAGVEITALADIFPDQLEKGRQRFDAINASLNLSPIDPKRLFHGPEAYKAIAECKEVDAVQISTPPFFHVEHLDAIVSAKKHAYCEKPVGVDIPQTRRALEIGKKHDGKVSMAVGFQIRSAPPFVELVRRIHDGQIGQMAQIAAYYNAPPAVSHEGTFKSKDEFRLRNWLHYRNLSGDMLLEQNIHVIDVCNWVMQTHIRSAPMPRPAARSSSSTATPRITTRSSSPTRTTFSSASPQPSSTKTTSSTSPNTSSAAKATPTLPIAGLCASSATSPGPGQAARTPARPSSPPTAPSTTTSPRPIR
ncbi:MAG: Gfo/Idh/MocA family oxidoreductase [Edaphobacter sp.]|uniref:Gfo/Idh/MocA family protein n=1 Tax=Edaphobacter sp. TaxID=1934404 RepID=UPI00238BE2BC|nr:Gfo/Idh/MocA family oxidoreductase [Edaphobacter sp.]MDE1177875.1 Gfo/Idh/MocA family oxidoreductase [Edaphobacter sp.]